MSRTSGIATVALKMPFRDVESHALVAHVREEMKKLGVASDRYEIVDISLDDKAQVLSPKFLDYIRKRNYTFYLFESEVYGDMQLGFGPGDDKPGYIGDSWRPYSKKWERYWPDEDELFTQVNELLTVDFIGEEAGSCTYCVATGDLPKIREYLTKLGFVEGKPAWL